ncbi:MAG: replication-associated recombination protein A [Lentisphaerae bacterium]|jgi:putative ATPase|nr:replication-associated recombination protein A [Lentisphaerota bacterium]
MSDKSDLFSDNSAGVAGGSITADPGGRDGVAARPPLAAMMRPHTLDEIVGQDHILGPGKMLRRVIESDRLTNLIFYGPPGCGKTTLAEVVARATSCRFERSSGVTSNVAGLRTICENARLIKAHHKTVLFIDEIHRFNKSQQDVLLPYVEDGTVTLIGATTHNPQVFINSPLTSRSIVFELKPLDQAAVELLIRRAIDDTERGLGQMGVVIDDAAAAFLADICEGDGRRALNALELAALSTPRNSDGVVQITRSVMEECVQRRMIVYDRDEDGHYDTISAFIKSVRGSDPHAATYWLAKMIEAGEDPRFIARRILILASEDIGNADPRGLTVATAAMQAVEYVGMPEARIILAQATTYLATAPKSNASYVAIDAALADVRAGRVLAVPEHLKNIHVKGVGSDVPDHAYRYPHDYDGHAVAQRYLPAEKCYYQPSDQGYESTIRKRMEQWATVVENSERE